jgi:hypothetical protein
MRAFFYLKIWNLCYSFQDGLHSVFMLVESDACIFLFKNMEPLLLHPFDEKPCYVQPQRSSMRVADKKRSASEKNFSLDVLRKYFSGSLRDAAMSLGGEPYCIVTKSLLNLDLL